MTTTEITKQSLLRVISFGTMAVVVAVLMAATVIEKLYGTPTAIEKVYTSWWMIFLWTIMAVSGLVYIMRLHMWRQFCTYGIHGALVLILVGALTTHLCGVQGYIHLRQGMPPTKSFYVNDGSERILPFLLTLNQFEVQYYPDDETPQDYTSHLTITEKSGDNLVATVSMNKILRHKNYRFCQTDYDKDEHGTLLSINYDPYGTSITYTGYLLLLFSMIGFFAQRQSGFRQLLRASTLAIRIAMVIGIVCGVVLATMMVLSYTHSDQPLIPVLRSPLLGIHVAVIMIAYALLACVTICGIVAEVQFHCKGCHSHTIEQLHIASRLMLYPALFLLMTGIFIGATWANVSWGRYWGWDPKEVWALITMLVYAVPIHNRSIRWFASPITFLRYCMVAFLCVLITYFGVNLLFGGMHSYA